LKESFHKILFSVGCVKSEKMVHEGSCEPQKRSLIQ